MTEKILPGSAHHSPSSSNPNGEWTQDEKGEGYDPHILRGYIAKKGYGSPSSDPEEQSSLPSVLVGLQRERTCLRLQIALVVLLILFIIAAILYVVILCCQVSQHDRLRDIILGS